MQVRSFAKEAAAVERYQKAQGAVLTWGLKSAVASGVFFGANTFLAFGAIMAVLWFGARQVMSPDCQMGYLGQTLGYCNSTPQSACSQRHCCLPACGL